MFLFVDLLLLDLLDKVMNDPFLDSYFWVFVLYLYVKLSMSFYKHKPFLYFLHITDWVIPQHSSHWVISTQSPAQANTGPNIIEGEGCSAARTGSRSPSVGIWPLSSEQLTN